MEVKCKLQELGSLAPCMEMEGEKKKLGRYEGGAVPPLEGTDKRWAVAANIILEEPIKHYLDSGLTEKQLVEKCVKFLNKKPYRARKLPYGDLGYRHFIIHSDRISISLMTNDRNNKHFWGRGDVQTMKKNTKRGRPRKNK
jgi:hypothetical protein|tara:strand:+ start:328 stop:750 length:423 start_codon:yes stop_codon:yes gene_type:complete